MLELKNIRKSFGDVEVLKDVSLTVKDGEVVAILGPSGSGKTTLLRCINSLTPADDGVIVVGDENFQLKNISGKDVRRLRRDFGFVFQNYNLFANKTALENVTEGLIVARKMKKKEAEEIGRQALAKVGMLERSSHYPSQLSGGQQQRVAIARAIALNPDVLLLDEPTSALDPELTGEVLDVIKKLADDSTTMIIVTHEVGFARNVADHIVFMEGGVVVEEGPAKTFFANPREARTVQFLRNVVSDYDYVI